jgi:glutathione S-transferase
MTLIVHHLEHSRSQRIVWLLEELSLPYEVRRYARRRMRAPPELKNIHPLGKSPMVTDDGLVVCESGAIVEYLVDKAAGNLGAPADRSQALRYRHFLHFAEGSMMPPLFTLMVAMKTGPLGWPLRGTFRAMVGEQLDWLESELASRPWLTGGTFTAADVMMSFPVEFAQSLMGLGVRPHLSGWLGRLHARPAYQTALERGGPYDYFLPIV